MKIPAFPISRKNRWLWIALFVWAAFLITCLATGWNVVLVSNYLKMMRIAQAMRLGDETVALAPWPIVIAGTIGFVAAMGTIVLFFLRLLREMRLNQQQAEFLASVSHELKTPIAAMELSSSLIRAGGLSQQESDALWQSHQSELKRLREQVETILEAARWQNGPARSRSTSTDLEQWLNDSIGSWRGILGNDGQILREGEPLPRSAWVDPASLSLVTDNLFDNARKFARGAPKVTVKTVSLPATGNLRRPKWRIEFTDEGWGFDPSESRRIFQRFSRGHNECALFHSRNGPGALPRELSLPRARPSPERHQPGYGSGCDLHVGGPRYLSKKLQKRHDEAHSR